MKKALLFITALTLVFQLTACRAETPEEKTSRNIERFSSQVAESMAAFPENIVLPDGGTASKSELTLPGYMGKERPRGDFPWLEYAYIRYAEPIFFTSNDFPEKFDTEEHALKEPIKLKPFEWIKVKAGDILENGWKITSARSYCGYQNYDDHFDRNASVYDCEITLEGEFALDGIISFNSGYDAYGKSDNSLMFYPDSTKYRLPVPYNSYLATEAEGHDEPQLDRLTDDGLLAYDGAYFQYFRFGSDFHDKLGEHVSKRGTVTVKDLTANGDGYHGEILDIEF